PFSPTDYKSQDTENPKRRNDMISTATISTARRRGLRHVLTLALGTALLLPAGTTLDQDGQTLRILISQSPWLNAFIALVDQYQDETGTRFELDVTPFGGMMEKTRNSVRADTGQYDIVNL